MKRFIVAFLILAVAMVGCEYPQDISETKTIHTVEWVIDGSSLTPVITYGYDNHYFYFFNIMLPWSRSKEIEGEGHTIRLSSFVGTLSIYIDGVLALTGTEYISCTIP